MKKIILGNCFDRLRNIQEKSIDLIFIDPPYGKTNLSWDNVFDSRALLELIFKLIKDSGVILIFGREPMLSHYRIHAEKYYKYDFIWKKNRKNGYVLSRERPLQETEKIAVFSKGNIFSNSKTRMNYFPQFTVPCHVKSKLGKTKPKYFSTGCNNEGIVYTRTRKDFPTDIIECDQEWKTDHPTEKPIQLYEYLLLTFSQLGDTVLDPCFGSGNSIIAANTFNRNFIGIEMNKKYFDKLNNNLNYHDVCHSNT